MSSHGITTWDIMRLYGEAPVISTETISIDHTESSEIEPVPTRRDEDAAA